MEEYVGQLWHRFITNAASKEYPEAAVLLDDVRVSVGILFRALGGDAGLQIVNSFKTNYATKRNLLQRIAGTGKQVELATRNADQLSLPERIAIFPNKKLNRDLYLWLAVLATIDDVSAYWLVANSQKTVNLLQHYPGLRSRYQRLSKAHLIQRPKLDTLTKGEREQEKQIQMALQFPENMLSALPPEQLSKYAPQPVPLWLYPLPNQTGVIAQKKTEPPEINENDEQNEQCKQREGDRKRRKAERADMPNGKSGLLSFRMEALFSWSEYTKVDRTTEEDDDDNAVQAADDMDMLSIAQDDKKPPSKLKFDLDLPS